MRAKEYTERDFKRLLIDNGYYPDRSRGKGDHAIYVNGKGNSISVPSGRTSSRMLYRRLIKENHLRENVKERK